MKKKNSPSTSQTRSRSREAELRTVDIFSGKTAIEESEEVSRMASGADAVDIRDKVRDSSLSESAESEVRSAVRWISETSLDAKRAIVVARGTDGSVVISFMRSQSPHSSPSYIGSFRMSSDEAESLKNLINKV